MNRRGSVLLLCLLMTVLFLVMGMAFLASRAGSYRNARSAVQGLQARELAWAGLEDARAKFIHDYNFPPKAAVDQPAYRVTETVLAPDGTTVVGAYSVTINQRLQSQPYQILEVRSTGFLGTLENPLAERTIKGVLDLRGDPTTNPSYFQWLGVIDEGGI